jgi:hypothetical protein
MLRVCIEDLSHSEGLGEFSTFQDAVLELERLASIPWDQAPNRAPCTSWRSCGRRYEVIIYDDATEPWSLIEQVPMLEISASAVNWLRRS